MRLKKFGHAKPEKKTNKVQNVWISKLYTDGKLNKCTNFMRLNVLQSRFELNMRRLSSEKKIIQRTLYQLPAAYKFRNDTDTRCVMIDKKVSDQISSFHNQTLSILLTGFQNYFNDTFVSRFAINWSLRSHHTTPLLHCLVTISIQKLTLTFHAVVWRRVWGAVESLTSTVLYIYCCVSEWIVKIWQHLMQVWSNKYDRYYWTLESCAKL